MSSQFLSLRMGDEEARLIDRLHAKLGGSKSSIVKQAILLMAEQADVADAGDAVSLHTLGAARFGRHGDAGRQSANIKAVVRQRLAAKRDR